MVFREDREGGHTGRTDEPKAVRLAKQDIVHMFKVRHQGACERTHTLCNSNTHLQQGPVSDWVYLFKATGLCRMPRSPFCPSYLPYHQRRFTCLCVAWRRNAVEGVMPGVTALIGIMAKIRLVCRSQHVVTKRHTGFSSDGGGVSIEPPNSGGGEGSTDRHH